VCLPERLGRRFDLRKSERESKGPDDCQRSSPSRYGCRSAEAGLTHTDWADTVGPEERPQVSSGGQGPTGRRAGHHEPPARGRSGRLAGGIRADSGRRAPAAAPRQRLEACQRRRQLHRQPAWPDRAPRPEASLARPSALRLLSSHPDLAEPLRGVAVPSQSAPGRSFACITSGPGYWVGRVIKGRAVAYAAPPAPPGIDCWTSVKASVRHPMSQQLDAQVAGGGPCDEDPEARCA
jgi:hypothetical protein